MTNQMVKKLSANTLFATNIATAMGIILHQHTSANLVAIKKIGTIVQQLDIMLGGVI